MLSTYIRGSDLADLAAKVEAGTSLDRADGYRLARSADLLTIGYMADLVRRRSAGDLVYFTNNYHINHSNICYAGCKFCAFGVAANSPEAYTMDLAQIEAEAAAALAYGATEVHIIGGLNPHLSYDYYREVIRTVKRVHPTVCIQAYDAVEIEFIARVAAKKSVAEVLADLRADGLTALPGGGGEIFSDRVRNLTYKGKIGRDKYLEVHRIAHRMGMRSNCSILYGWVETPEERIDHLLDLRELQTETGGFLCFVSFPYHPDNTPLTAELLAAKQNVPAATTGVDDLRHHAIARIMLDNIPHIRAFWMALGMKMAQAALSFGVNDLDGTVRKERIIHDAGAATAQEANPDEMVFLIRQAGRIPVERDTLYNHLRQYDLVGGPKGGQSPWP